MTITTWELVVPPDFSFHETLHAHGWRHLRPFAWEDESKALSRPQRLADGRIVLLELRDSPAGAVGISVTDSSAHGPISAMQKAEIERSVRHMLQLDISLERFHAFCSKTPSLVHIPAIKQGRLLCSPTVWEDYVKVVLTTNTTWAQTKSMTARMVSLFGPALPFDPSRHAFPAPAEIAAIPFAEFAAAARLGYRASSIHTASTQIAEGSQDVESLRTAPAEMASLWRTLLALPGVGPYAASCLLLYLGRPERVNVDSWARMLLSKEVGHPVTDKEVYAFFAPYGDWQGLVYNFYPWTETTA